MKLDNPDSPDADDWGDQSRPSVSDSHKFYGLTAELMMESPTSSPTLAESPIFQ